MISLCICWCCAAHSMKLPCRYMYRAVNLMQVLHTGLALLWCQSLVWLMQASIWTLYLSFIHTLFPLCKDYWYLKPSWSSLRYPFILLIIIRISLLIFMYRFIQSSFIGWIVWFWHHDWRDINIFTCCINK